MPDQPAQEPPEEQLPEDGAAEPEEHEEPGKQQPDEAKDSPQDPWSARSELLAHAPEAISGSLVAGNQIGVSGGFVAGNVITNVHNYRLFSSMHTSGTIPARELDERRMVFAGYDQLVLPLRERLLEERVLVLSGAPFSGRYSAALMLLHTVKATPVRALDPKILPTALAGELREDSGGYLISDLVTGRDKPLRKVDLWAVRETLTKHDAFMVITVDLHAVLDGVQDIRWTPPSLEAALRSQLHNRVFDPQRERDLLRLAPAQEFIRRKHHQLREAQSFASALADHAQGKVGLQQLADVRDGLLRGQVQEWFSSEETDLRDKAFLISLAAFDEVAYALTAELSDDLYREFQLTEDRRAGTRVGIFGTSITNRLQLARAEEYTGPEKTEWGEVRQRKARFLESKTSGVVLHEVWTGHPSARPALIKWLKHLVNDGRPLVRNRAAATAAILAGADLASAMALLIEPWAKARLYRTCLVAANSLAMAHAIGTPNVPGILDAWCRKEDPKSRLRWTAIHTYALVGATMPEQALDALVAAARTAADDAGAKHVAQSVALLLTAEEAEPRRQVLTGLTALLDDDPPVRQMALRAFVLACAHYGGTLRPEGDASPAPSGASGESQLQAGLWRAALSDLTCTGDALAALRDRVVAAEQDPDAERQLRQLLPALALTTDERGRISHALETLRVRRERPEVVGRLLPLLRGTPDRTPR